MTTNKIQLRTVEQFMADYTPVYQPIYPLFLGGKSQSYSRDVGQINFRRNEAVGDIRTKHITPKDTEIRQVAVIEGKKAFKKYFLANQFILSNFQNAQDAEEVTAQVLDEHHVQADELLMLGEGTDNTTMINNGLFYSGDSNYTLNSSATIASDSTQLYDFHSKVLTTTTLADQVAGRKVIFFYGTAVLPLFNSLYSTAVKAWKQALADVLGPNYSFVQIPVASTPSGASGWIVVNMDQCKLHYTELPQLLAQGQNEEKMYLWFNFLMGSMMLEVLAKNGIIRQPATIAA